MEVSELIVKFMERLGIRQIFGIPGAHILPVYDRLYDSSIHSILVKHEQGAAFMAGGVARSSGKIGACIATAGPGATNMVTGIANAYADQLPLLVITGETPTHIFGKGGLQESSGEGGSIDQHQLFQGITRYHRVIERADYLPNVLTQAAQILLSDNPGPVVLSLPYNVQKEIVDEQLLEPLPLTPHNLARPPLPQQVESLQQKLVQASHPVIIAGYGCIAAGAAPLVQQLSEQYGIPVTTTLKGKGVIDEQTDTALGTLGVTSDGHAFQQITQQADLLLILGASFNERTSYLWNPALLAGKQIIQVDQQASQLGKVFQTDLAIESDIKTLLEQLLAIPHLDHPLATEEVTVGEEESPIIRSTPPLIRHFFHSLNQHFSEEEIALFDDNIIYGQTLFQASARHHYIPNSGISSLGHAIPAAIGASLQLNIPTFALLGDGGFQMCCMELMTAVNYNIPLNVLLLNNSSMGLIRKNQFQHYEGRYIDCDFTNPDFAQLAQSFGIQHYSVTDQDTVTQLFEQCDFHKGINLIEIPIDKNAFPDYQSGR